jgi:taurine dioxygenase
VSLRIERQAGALGAYVYGVDLARELDDATFDQLHAAFVEHHVICIRDQEITPDQQLAFARRWGAVFVHPYVESIEGHPGIMAIGDPNDITTTWHSDTTHAKRPPRASMLLARCVPDYGGDTVFANQHLAWEDLSEGLRAVLSQLRAIHRGTELAADQGLTPREVTNAHPVGRQHPETGRRALFVNADYTAHFERMSEEESRPILEFLYSRACLPRYTWRHHWRVGDLLSPSRATNPIELMSSARTIPAARLRGYCAGILCGLGVPPEQADTVADSLVEADLRGVESHGANLIALYVSRIRAGSMRPRTEIRVISDDGPTLQLHGGLGPGQVAGVAAIEHAIERARGHGMAAVSVRESTHLGALAYYTLRAAEQGLFCMAFQNGPTVVPAFGGITPLFSTNPFSYAVPAGEEAPIVYDVATTAVAGNKLLLARKRGESIPEGWATDDDGVPTTDPERASLHDPRRLALPAPRRVPLAHGRAHPGCSQLGTRPGRRARLRARRARAPAPYRAPARWHSPRPGGGGRTRTGRRGVRPRPPPRTLTRPAGRHCRGSASPFGTLQAASLANDSGARGAFSGERRAPRSRVPAGPRPWRRSLQSISCDRSGCHRTGGAPR